MRILDVSPRSTCPPLRGSSVRTWNLLAELSGRHAVRQLALAPRERSGVTASPFHETRLGGLATAVAALGARAWTTAPLTAGAGLRLFPNRELRRALEWADVALVEFPWLFETCRRTRRASRLVLSTHNVETEKFVEWAEAAGRPLTRSLWLRYVERAEARAVAEAELVIAVSGSDRETFIERFGADPSRVVEVPNGADPAAIALADTGPPSEVRRRLGLVEQPTAVFAGSNTPANRAGLEWVRRLAALVPDVTFLVIGAVCAPGRNANLVSCGVVDDVGPCLAAADVALCPIEYGGGTKIKLLEAMAAGLPAIVFAESTRGLDVSHRKNVFVADKTPGSLAAALREIVRDRRFAAALGEAGRRLVLERYTWSRSARILEAALQHVVWGTAPAVPQSSTLLKS